MHPRLSLEMVREKVNKVGFNVYPDILVSQEKAQAILTELYDKYPEHFQRVQRLKDDVFALARTAEKSPRPEHTFVMTPKGCTLTFTGKGQSDELIKKITIDTIAQMRSKFPIRKIPRVGRIVEIVLEWQTIESPHEWLRENFTVFDANDDVDEVNFRFLYRKSGMNINTVFTPMKHKQTGNWGLQVICDINNSDTSGDVDQKGISTLIDFSTLYFPDRTFEFLNRHIND